ncbi:MAG: phosphate ABC transporter substrate-binding protein [Calditrichota bacterium]
MTILNSNTLIKTAALAVILLLISCAGLQKAEPTVIRIQGSDTMLKLMQQCAAEFMEENPLVSIYVDGGGTSVGLERLIAGAVDICMASRTLRPDESVALADNYQSVGMSILIAKDALSVYLNPDNPVRDLTPEQLKLIFTGVYTNWNEVGGREETILLASRPSNSGTHLYFRERILDGEEYEPSSLVLSTTESVINYIRKHPNAIGYGGFAYGPDLPHIKINGVEPTESSIRDDQYPITRYLLLYTLEKPRGEVKKFIDWMTDVRGQVMVREAGYVPLWK